MAIVGGFSPTHLKNYASQNGWTSSPIFRGENAENNIFELSQPSKMTGSWVAAFQRVTGRHQHAKQKNVWQNYEILKDF